MSDPTNQNQQTDQRLDENLARLLNDRTQQPELSAEADARILAALLEKQSAIRSELITADQAQPNEDHVVTKPTNAHSHARLSLPTSAYAGVVSLILAVAVVGIIGAVFWGPKWNSPPDQTGPRLGPQAEVPAATFEAGELTRKELDDGTVLIAHSGTKFTVAGPREVQLEQGDLYLIVAKSDQSFTVKTSDGEVIATGTRFVVSSGEKTTAAVAQGKVKLAGKSGNVELQAGEQGELTDGDKPTRRPAPRLSYLVSWAKEALAQDELLVEKAETENGLVAMDPWGQQTRLTLRKYHVDVHIEDGIARTTIDQTFFNHYPWNSEGTFYFPLPPDASVSRLAMYVFGQLNEGGMVERGRGQQIYNDILYQRRDPALLEMMEGNVFKMRIFPLEGRQEKRIFLSYTQDLDELYGRGRYWFPMDHTNSIAKELSIRVRIKGGAEQFDPQSSTHEMEAKVDGDDLVLTYHAEKIKPDQDLLLHLVPKTAPPATRVATCQKDGQQFLFARFSPEIPGTVEPKPRQWIVVNDVSASRTKIDAQAQQYIMQRLIEEADDDDSLFLINLNTQPELVSEKFTPIRSRATRKLIARAAAPRLGATNLVSGMEAAADVIEQHRVANPHILYLGDGVATDGSTEVFEPVRAVPRGATFVGVGVGKKVDSLFLQEAADRTGGTFTTINPDEDIDWRVFDMIAALNTPRLTKIKVELQNPTGQPVKAIAYPNARSLAHGETLTVVARAEDELPAKIVLSGDVGDKPYRSVAEVADAKPAAEYIPRLWAKRHIDELLKSDMGREQEIIALSKQYYVVTPLTSLIVLEDDKMYEEYKVERGRKDHWALYGAPKEIEVVKEPVDWKRWGWYYGGSVGDDEKIKAEAKPKTVREIVDSVQIRIDAPFYYWRQRDDGHDRYAMYQLLDSETKPTNLMTYWLLLAGGEREMAIDFRRGGSGASEDGPAPSSRPAATSTVNPYPPLRLESVGKDMILPALIQLERGERDRRQLAMLPMFTQPNARGGELAAGKLLMRPPGLNATGGFFMPSMLIDDSRRSAGPGFMMHRGISVSGRLPPMLNVALRKNKRLAPSMVLSDISLESNSHLSTGLVRPELAMSFQQEVTRRWSRIDRDIRDFNRRYGYWDGWGGWYEGDSIDLTRSARANWYGGLEGFDEESEPQAEGEIATSGEMLPFSILDVLDGKKKLADSMALAPPGTMGPQIAVAWLNVLGHSIKTQPGACSVLAADFLATRRAELSGDDLTEEQLREWKAIDHALANLDTAAARLESTGRFWGYEGWHHRPQPWTFHPPTVQVHHGYNWSYDLTRYTPALQSTSFDILNEVVAQYGDPTGTPQGTIEDDAREQIAAARAAQRAITVRFEKDGLGLHVASGDRYALSLRTDMYLEERMICDGEQIVHRYDELGLAARRPATALRLAALRGLAPHLIEPAEVLSQRYDAALEDATDDGFTLKLTPIGQEEDAEQPIGLTVRVDREGRILEKLLTVEEETQLKLTFTFGDGEITAAWFDADEKELTKVTYFAEPLADNSVFENDLSDLVVFDMPLRKPSFYQQKIDALAGQAASDEQSSNEAAQDDPQAVAEKIRLKRHHALASIQQLQWRRWGGRNDDAQKSLTDAFDLCKQAKQDVKIGDLTLFGSAGVHNAADDLKQHARVDEAHPVFRYYKLRHSDFTKAQTELEGHMNGLLGHLAAYQASARRHDQSKHYDFFTETFPESPLLLAATYYAANWGNNPDVWSKMYAHPQWRLLAMMMAAPHLQTKEQRSALAEAYANAYDEFAEDEIDLPVTAQMVAYLKEYEEGTPWKRITGAKLMRAKEADSTAALLKFAEDAMSWGEAPLADEALLLARERLAERNTLSGRFALAQTLWAGGRMKDAMKLYDEIFTQLKAKNVPPSAGLLASAARLAQQSGDLAKAIDLEERALAAEHPHLPDLINLQAFRQRYNWLWQQYQSKVAQAVDDKDAEAVSHWLARAEATWGRWHEVDPDNHNMVTQMATLQMTADRRDASWLYLSTIIDQHPRDANSHNALAQWYRGRNELEKAEDRLAQAYLWDTANPRWLWERGQLLDSMDRGDEARVVYQQIVDGEWAVGLQQYVEQAKEALNQR